ncbi:MAG: L,D-transpeptidase family protein [Eubacteriales bacterium]|nr:L,D-transpeptidase family protein [Eubacteriales bacterium]
MSTEKKETINNQPSSGNSKLDEIKRMIADLEVKMDTTNFKIFEEESNIGKKAIDDILNQTTETIALEEVSKEAAPSAELLETENPSDIPPEETSLEVESGEDSSSEEITEKDDSEEEITEEEKAEEAAVVAFPPLEEAEIKDASNDVNKDVILQNAPEKKSHWLRNLLLALIVIALLGYGGACYYFSSHFFYRTIIWGHDCSFKTVEETKSIVKESIGHYKIDLKERENRTETLTAQDLGLDLLEDGSIENLLKSQKNYLCITSLWQTRDYQKDVNLNLNDDVLSTKVAALQLAQAENIVAPKDSFYEYQKEAKKFVIVPEVYGTTIDQEVFLPALKKAILSKEEFFDLEKNGCYLNPKIYSNDENLVKESNALNEYMTTDIIYDFDDRKEEVGPDRLSGWLSINEKQEAVLDKTAVRDFLRQLGKKYDTLGKKRKFKSLTGRMVEVSGGTYGWVLNEDKEYKKLLYLIKKHKSVTREPEYKHKGICRKKNDIGKTYVDIDLSRQHMDFFKKGKRIVSTPVVTGDVSKGRGTPSGVYYILYKQRNHVLRGPGYASYVNYWMPFIGDRGIGIHDSSWRGSYGGSIYNGSGSHGCVNTPESAVSKIFNNIEANTPVVVHW